MSREGVLCGRPIRLETRNRTAVVPERWGERVQIVSRPVNAVGSNQRRTAEIRMTSNRNRRGRVQNRHGASLPRADEHCRWRGTRVGFQSRVPGVGVDSRVQEKSVFPAIRRDIHEANQPIALKGGQVNQGTAEYRAKVAAVLHIPTRREQGLQRLVFRGGRSRYSIEVWPDSR